MARTILLADDSVTIQKVVELTFLDEDFRVVSFGNGSDAAARLGELRPDVVLADVHMPGMDGYDLCAATQAALPGVPVLLLVGTFEVFDAQRAAEVGAAGHLKKPFDSQELLQRVQELAGAEPAGEAPAATAAEAASGDFEALPAIEFDAPAPSAPIAESWSFEPSADAGAPDGEVAADTWGGVVPEGEQAAEESADEPVWVPESEVEEPAAVAATGEFGADEAVSTNGGAQLSAADVDRIARRVVELMADQAVRDVAWEIVPDLAEVLLKARIRELEASVE